MVTRAAVSAMLTVSLTHELELAQRTLRAYQPNYGTEGFAGLAIRSLPRLWLGIFNGRRWFVRATVGNGTARRPFPVSSTSAIVSEQKAKINAHFPQLVGPPN
jgi:hypothetical protein